MTTTSEGAGFVPLTREDFEAAYAKVSPHIYHTPLLTSRLLSERPASTSGSRRRCSSAPARTRSAGR